MEGKLLEGGKFIPGTLQEYAGQAGTMYKKTSQSVASIRPCGVQDILGGT